MSSRALWLTALVILAGGCKATGEAPAAARINGLADASFDPVASVLLSPRCVNCHPNGNSPHQGDEHRVHDYRVTRGADDRGAPAMRCSTCHQEANQDSLGIPGAKHWQLAPISMAWEGLSKAQLCRAVTDPKRNGGRSTEQLVHHMSEDALVLWAWNPGGSRLPPPLSRPEFVAAVEAWAKAGAKCPQGND